MGLFDEKKNQKSKLSGHCLFNINLKEIGKAISKCIQLYSIVCVKINVKHNFLWFYLDNFCYKTILSVENASKKRKYLDFFLYIF
jgi:hypothetical protein